MKPKIYVLIGLPGSGKSTWAKRKVGKEKNTVIVNKDSLRLMINGGKYVYDECFENMIKDFATTTMRIALGHGFDVIVDETNLTRDKRKIWNYIDMETIGVWFTESKRNLEYRLKDTRGYAPAQWMLVIENMRDVFEKPTKDEFNKLIRVNKV